MDDDWHIERVPQDEDSSEVRLSDTRLYVCSIPEDITDKGLERVFSKFGTVVATYMSPNVNKRFALITFDNSKEANQAILALNHKPPLNLTVRFANDGKSRNSMRPTVPSEGGRYRHRSDAPQHNAAPRDNVVLRKLVSECEDIPPLKMSPRPPSSLFGSVKYSEESPGRNLQGELPLEQDTYPYEEEIEDYDYDYGMYEDEYKMYELDDVDFDAYEINSEILYIKQQELNLQKAKQNFLRKSLQRPLFTRERYVPQDLKRIVVRTDHDASTSNRKVEPIEYTEAIAGHRRGQGLEVKYAKPYSLDVKEVCIDALSSTSAGLPFIPPLVKKNACVVCQRPTSTYCSSCEVTAYCSLMCQRGDWLRHRTVCHNQALNPKASSQIIHDAIPDKHQLANDNIAQRQKILNRGPPAHYKKPEFKSADDQDQSSSRSQKHDDGNNLDRSPRGNARDNIDGNAKGNTRGNFERNRNDNEMRPGGGIRDFTRPRNDQKEFDGPRHDRKDGEGSYRKPFCGYGVKNMSFNTPLNDRPRHERNDGDGSYRKLFNGDGAKNKSFDGPLNDRPRHDRNDGDGSNRRPFNGNSGKNKSFDGPRNKNFDSKGDRNNSVQETIRARPLLKCDQTKRNEDNALPSKAYDNRPSEEITASPKPGADEPAKPAQADTQVTTMAASAAEEMQEKEVPLRYTGELTSVGDNVMISVESVSEGKVLGCVFVVEQADDYAVVCDVLAGECEADQQEYKASPGEVFCVRDPTDDGWYRGRCLTDHDGGSAALIDAGRLLPVQGNPCRKIPARFLEIQEFAYEGTTNATLAVGQNYYCVIKSKSGGVITVTVAENEGPVIGEATITRWRPPVEQPKPKTPSHVVPTDVITNTSEPAAQKPETTHQKAEPIPQKPEPTPLKPETALQKPEPTPLKTELTPQKLEPTPQKTELTPQKLEPTPQKTEPSPQKRLSFKQSLFQKNTQTATTVKDVPESFVANEAAMHEPFSVAVEAVDGDKYVCLTITEKHIDMFQMLMGSFTAVCEQDSVQIVAKPGELLSVRNPTDELWYRARYLSAAEGGLAALVDSGKLLPLVDVPCRCITEEYSRIPEFCCVLETASKLEVGSNFLCEPISSSEGIVSVVLSNADDVTVTFEGKMSRWRPPVIGAPTASTSELNTPTASLQPSPLELYGTVVEEWSYPEVESGAVVITDVGSAQCISVRSANATVKRQYDATLVDVCTHGDSASRLTVPSPVGAVVLAEYEDNVFYRAAVRKTKHTNNKYWLEYMDFGNEGPSQLEKMRACPPELAPSARPVLVSRVKLQEVTCVLSKEALVYLNTLKDEETPLLLSLSSGERAAPSGSEVVLSVASSKQQINSKVQDMSLPVWEKLFKEGKSVTDLPVLGLDDVEYVSLPAAGAELRVLNTNLLRSELCTVTACPADEPALAYVDNVLPKQLAAYCSSELGSSSYLPRPYELCVVKFPERDIWCRAVMVEQMGGPGGSELSVLCLDHGEMGTVPVANVRKMLAEFMKKPTVGLVVFIQDLVIVSDAVEQRARGLLESGTLSVRNCTSEDKGEYRVEAPAFIAALADAD